MYAVSAKTFCLLYGFAEGDCPLVGQLLEDRKYYAVLKIGKVFYPFTTVKEPLVFKKLLPGSHVSVLCKEYLVVHVTKFLLLGAGNYCMHFLFSVALEFVKGAFIKPSLCLWIYLYCLCWLGIVKLYGKEDNLGFRKHF